MSSCIYSGNTVGVFPDLLYVPVRAWLGKPKEDNVSPTTAWNQPAYQEKMSILKIPGGNHMRHLTRRPGFQIGHYFPLCVFLFLP